MTTITLTTSKEIVIADDSKYSLEGNGSGSFYFEFTDNEDNLVAIFPFDMVASIVVSK